MNYLLIQILVCLLIAGLIGLVIGWLLRGGCKAKLLDKSKDWEEKLNANERTWKKQVQTLISEKENDKKRSKHALEEGTNKYVSLETRYKELESRNMHLTSEREQVRDICYKEFEDEAQSLENRVSELTQKLSEERNALKAKELELNEHFQLNKTLRAREVAWKSKVRGLMTENLQTKEKLEKEFNRVQAQLSMVEDELKTYKDNN